MLRIVCIILGLWALGNAVADDWAAQRAEVLKLADLTEAPILRDQQGNVCKLAPGELKQVYFDALEYEGKRTRVFAWAGMQQYDCCGKAPKPSNKAILSLPEKPLAACYCFLEH